MAFGDHVQSADLYDGSGTTHASVSVTLTNPVGVGNFIVVTCGGFTAEIDITFSDDKGNTNYVARDLVTYSNGYLTKIAYLLNITNGPSTITATYATGARNFNVLSVDEFGGTPYMWMEETSQLLHQNATTITTNNISTNASGDLLFAVTDNETNTTITGPGAPWTSRQPANAPFHAVMYSKQFGPGVASGTFSYAATSTDAWAAIYAFAPMPTPLLMGEQSW